MTLFSYKRQHMVLFLVLLSDLWSWYSECFGMQISLGSSEEGYWNTKVSEPSFCLRHTEVQITLGDLPYGLKLKPPSVRLSVD